ncbi:MAG: hypothetical protein C5B52_03995 [Bacteroidetes bacterium]|nr:MAG: hypothetical protein C5B52_03995 [Bacteroidota bacterium]
MDTSTMLITAGVIFVAIFGSYIFFYQKEKRELKKESQASNSKANGNLQLQAYERLVILAERISLRSLVARIPSNGISAREFQAVLTDHIKHEYDYNLSQQLYVSPQAWQAVTNLKEQNIFILHQLTQSLPAEATGFDLSKAILELLDADPKTSLHNIVLEALRFEARKLM